MSYASLLLHLDDCARVDNAFDVAVRLARRFEAHLAGLATPDGAHFFPDPNIDPLDPDRPRRLAAEAVARFEGHARRLGLKSFEGLVAGGDGIEALLGRGRLADLVVVRQADPGRPAHASEAALVARVVLEGAPPTLVVPHVGRQGEIGDHVLVAWTDTRPTARAIAAAMPLLRQARQVTLMHVVQAPLRDAPGLEPHLAEVVRWLGHHGVRATATLEPSEVEPADALLSRVADLGVDLVVMGAWSHSRLVERVRGGVTRTMLASMTVPVLMAH
jgi:nucleotide-binding universal stress UspA family protein